MKHKTIFGIIAIAILTTGTVLFIQKSNDHRECQTLKYTETRNGVVTVHTQHNCKEKYSF